MILSFPVLGTNLLLLTLSLPSSYLALLVMGPSSPAPPPPPPAPSAELADMAWRCVSLDQDTEEVGEVASMFISRPRMTLGQPASQNGFILVSVRGLQLSAASFLPLFAYFSSPSLTRQSQTLGYSALFRGENLDKVTKVGSAEH